MFEFSVHVTDCVFECLLGDVASDRASFRVDDGGLVQEGVVSVIVFCDCVEPLTRYCGEGVGEFRYRCRCMLKAVGAALHGCYKGSFPPDSYSP